LTIEWYSYIVILAHFLWIFIGIFMISSNKPSKSSKSVRVRNKLALFLAFLAVIIVVIPACEPAVPDLAMSELMELQAKMDELSLSLKSVQQMIDQQQEAAKTIEVQNTVINTPQVQVSQSVLSPSITVVDAGNVNGYIYPTCPLPPPPLCPPPFPFPPPPPPAPHPVVPPQQVLDRDTIILMSQPHSAGLATINTGNSILSEPHSAGLSVAPATPAPARLPRRPAFPVYGFTE
jgi:hypothetical protein